MSLFENEFHYESRKIQVETRQYFEFGDLKLMTFTLLLKDSISIAIIEIFVIKIFIFTQKSFERLFIHCAFLKTITMPLF